MAAGVSTRNRATMEKSSLLLELKACAGQRGYPLQTPRLENTVLDAHTREPITVITERYLGVLRFCIWSQPGHNQKSALFIYEIRVERSHSMFSTNCHKIDITTGDLLLLFLTFSALVANPKKLLFYSVANTARGLLNRGKKKKSGSGPPPLRAARSEKNK